MRGGGDGQGGVTMASTSVFLAWPETWIPRDMPAGFARATAYIGNQQIHMNVL